MPEEWGPVWVVETDRRSKLYNANTVATADHQTEQSSQIMPEDLKEDIEVEDEDHYEGDENDAGMVEGIEMVDEQGQYGEGTSALEDGSRDVPLATEMSLAAEAWVNTEGEETEGGRRRKRLREE